MKQTYTQAQIVKNISGRYVVVTQSGQQLSCIARKKISYQGQKLMVGDYVQIDQQNQSIENVLPRQNALTRPPVANIAQVFIFIAPQPEPDYFLIDKILFIASLQNITPILVLNKTDISSSIGISNSINRVRIMDPESSISITSAEGQGCTIDISMKIQKEKNENTHC